MLAHYTFTYIKKKERKIFIHVVGFTYKNNTWKVSLSSPSFVLVPSAFTHTHTQIHTDIHM